MTYDNQNTRLDLSNQPFIIPPLHGEMLQADGISCQFKITSDISKDQLGVYEIVLQPGAIGARLHFHRYTDEVFVVLKGTLTIQSSETIQNVGEGTVIQIPRLTPHAFCNNAATETKILLVFNPARKREFFFRELFLAIREKKLNTPAFHDLNLRYDSFLVDA
jgi:quercetin dioxygenase-like cupin family protein